MSEPGRDISERALADHYDTQHDTSGFGDPVPVHRAERLDVTISVQFTPAEIADARTRAREAGMKPTAYIRRCALEREDAPLDKTGLARAVDALARDLEDLRIAAG